MERAGGAVAAESTGELRVHQSLMKSQPASSKTRLDPRWAGCFLALGIFLSLPMSLASAQQTSGTADNKQDRAAAVEAKESTPAKLRRLPIEWLIGPYIPVQGALYPLNNKQREQVYLRRTFFTAGPYIARAFSAGFNQARGFPYQWDDGMAGYGKRYAALYGRFVIQNTLAAAGDAALRYEPRYDFCRCNGFWRRTRHAVSRNFVAYNRSESELRPRVPLYAGAFAAGMIYTSWLPQQNSVWKGGLYTAVLQAGSGSAYNFVSEFAFDILHQFGIKK